jgi:hypothetical protein
MKYSRYPSIMPRNRFQSRGDRTYSVLPGSSDEL